MSLVSVWGKLVLWMGWPFFYFYLRSTLRTRVLVVAEDKALCIKVWHAGTKWTLPGGGVDKGESAKQSAVREVAEETGVALQAGKLKDQGEVDYRMYGIRFRLARFAAELPRPVKLSPQLLEIREAAWVPLNELTDRTCDAASRAQLASWRAKK